jgi:hypothetical protein
MRSKVEEIGYPIDNRKTADGNKWEFLHKSLLYLCDAPRHQVNPDEVMHNAVEF